MSFSPRGLFAGLIVAAVIFEVISDTLFKYWSNTQRLPILVVGVVLYIASTVFWAFSLKHEHLSKAITVFTVANLIAVLAVGRWVFHESVSWQAKTGILLGIISVILMEV